ncbi:Lissencephaly-1 [Mycoemilia scoparia]|uniref:Nuclear distribution protein PAC1 n=1 Tax=Mycoemilia scoparia TaxID=417184 RepID=A0A9W8A2L2_9FUNG|nr:Lissencephaly-1 [Mycoemilia scoparia]
MSNGTFLVVLPDRQKKDLEKGILDFLHNNGYTESYDIFKKESQHDDFNPDPKDRYHHILAKKWNSISRLQKKILELEQKNLQLKKELESAPVRKTTSTTDWLPRPPEKYTLGQHRSAITHVRFHPEYSVIATASDDMTIKIWDPETGEFERTLKGHTKTVHDIAFSPNGKILVSCSADLTLRLWDIENEYQCSKTMYGHDHCVSSLAFLGPDKIISGSRDETIKIWELRTGYCVQTLQGFPSWVRYVRPDSTLTELIVASGDRVVLREINSKENRLDIHAHENMVECAIYAPIKSTPFLLKLAGIDQKPDKEKSQFFLSASRDKTIKLWDRYSGQLVYTFKGHDNWVRELVVHPSGKYLISASDDKTMRIWDLSTGRCIKKIEAATHFVTCIDFSTVNPLVATGSVDNQVKIWTCR